MRGTAQEAVVDALYRELLAAGEDRERLRRTLTERQPDDLVLLGVLRRSVPLRLLELLAATPPWSDRPRVLAGVVLSPRVPQPLALRLVSSLYWRDLADVALSPRLPNAVKLRAEALLIERLPELRLGERITLGRLATPALLRALFAEPEPKVAHAVVRNPRLREGDLAMALSGDAASLALLEQASLCARWRESYRIRLALAQQPRCPLAVALAQLSGLLPADLLRVAANGALPALVQLTAHRLLSARGTNGS